MPRTYQLLLLVSLSVLFPSYLQAQGQLGVHLVSNRSSQSLANAGLQNGWGGQLEFWSPGLPLIQNFELRVGLSGAVTRHGSFETGIEAYDDRYTEPLGLYELRTHYFQGLGMIRLIGMTHRAMQPYASFGIGGNQIEFNDAIRYDRDGPGGSSCPKGAAARPLERHTGITYNFGAGFLYRIHPEIRMEFGIHRLEGENLHFVDHRTIEVSGANQYGYGTEEHRQDQWMLRLGFSFDLKKSRSVSITPPETGLRKPKLRNRAKSCE